MVGGTLTQRRKGAGSPEVKDMMGEDMIRRGNISLQGMRGGGHHSPRSGLSSLRHEKAGQYNFQKRFRTDCRHYRCLAKTERRMFSSRYRTLLVRTFNFIVKGRMEM